MKLSSELIEGRRRSFRIWAVMEVGMPNKVRDWSIRCEPSGWEKGGELAGDFRREDQLSLPRL